MSDPDETAGRALYRARAEAEARRSLAETRKVRLLACTLAAVALSGCYRGQAREAAAAAGYDPASIRPRPFGICLKGREAYTVTAADGRRAKVCAGGLIMAPSITPLKPSQEEGR